MPTGTARRPTIVVDGPLQQSRFGAPYTINRLEAADFAVLMAALDQVEANRNVRCLIITATGPTFSAVTTSASSALGGDNDEMSASATGWRTSCSRRSVP